ncbi:MAG: hypothetical protein U1F56_10255 [Rubrivivax sp.]
MTRTRLLIVHTGSLRTTLALMALLGVVVLAGSATGEVPGLGVALALLLLGLNLLAALVVHPAFRRRLPLLVFHLALLALVLLVGWGRLASIGGRFELAEGVPFDGRLIDGERGALYRGGLERLSFRHQGFEIDYAPGRRRGATRNQVAWTDALGRAQTATIGDHRPLVLDGHRITTSPNKGFAPILHWQPGRGEPVLGAVHLPSYPMHELRQSREWTLPDGRTAWVQLQFDETLIDPQSAGRFRLPQQHRLVLRVDGQRHELAPGEWADLGGGRIGYVRLGTWMGYRVSHDPSLPWLLAASLVAGFALLWHYVSTAPARPQAARAPARWPREEVRHG